jgi:hypothetical protein
MSAVDMSLYKQAEDSLHRLSTPILYRESDPHDRVFFANFDGTGNDAIGDPDHETNVALIHDAISQYSRSNRNVASGYIKGPGTQENLVTRTIDGIRGYTHDSRVEDMYKQLARKANEWRAKDPEARISLVITGFSRGAEEAAHLTRLVHELGILDVTTLDKPINVRDFKNNQKTHPPLVAPGLTIQAVGLFDPVGTGKPQQRNRRLAPSVASGFQPVARDERRNDFPSSTIIPQGLSADGRFLGVTLPGAHSDVGGSYHKNGAGVLSFNLMADWINGHLEKPMIKKMALPLDQRVFVIHRSEDHLPIYRTSKFDEEGHRDTMGAQISPPHCRLVEACPPPEPLDPALVPLIGPRFPVTIGPVPDAAARPAMAPHLSAATPPEPSRREDVSLSWRDNRLGDTQEKDFSINFRAFDHDRFKEVGNIPVARDVYDEPDRTPASSLSPVGRAATPDPAHERTLLEQVDRINAQVARELGRPPISAAPMQAQIHSPEQSMRTDVSPSIRPDNVLPLSARPVATERAQLSQAPGSPPPENVRETQQHELAHRQWMDAPAGVPLAPPHAPQDRRQPEAERSAHDPRHRDHPDHALYQSINIQVAELHAREGIDVSNEQLDRVSTALLVEAKRNGVRQVTDVEFGQDASGRRTPDLIATEAFRGNPDDVRSRWAGIDASQAIAMPVETSSQQLQTVNQQLEQRMQQQQAQGMSEQQGMSMSR